MTDIKDQEANTAAAPDKVSTKAPEPRKAYALKKDVRQGVELLKAEDGATIKLTAAQAEHLKASGHI